MDCCAIYMCEEMVIQILSRLPVKSVMRFMAVCRLWKAIITSPQFKLVSERPTKLLVHTHGECFSLLEDGEKENRLIFETDFPLKDYYFHDSAEVIGSDNGLLCINMISRGWVRHSVIIWNPFIRQHVIIPDKTREDNEAYSNEKGYGFGGTISGGDYKYVRVVKLLLHGEVSMRKAVEIYSLEAGTWRRKYVDTDVKTFFPFSTLLRGRLHWIGGRTDHEIFSFDLEDEVFQDIIMVPESIQSNYLLEVSLTVIKESLAVIASEIEGRYYVVWVMEEYGDVKSWNKKFNIDLNKEDLYENVECNMVHLLKNDELLLGLLKREHPYKLNVVTYNQKTMKTCDFGGGSLSSLCGFTTYYKESLVLFRGR